jgi:Zn-dependent protease
LEQITQFIPVLLISALPIVFAIIAHEVMHGVVALQLGDDTALRAGRLTLNPISHVDLFGTIILPVMLMFLHLPVFGYAKPVPVDFSRLRNGRTGMTEVAAAGPLTNFVLAFVSAIGLRAMVRFSGGPLGAEVAVPLAYMFKASILVNVALGVFNLFPLLPLDGGRVLTGLLPLSAARAFAQTERYGFLILLVLLYTGWVNAVIDPIITVTLNVISRTLL